MRRVRRADRPALVGRYSVSAVLGSGSFGTVYVGRDPGTGLAVAVKVLDRDRRDDAVFMAALRAEADAMRRIDDPHCVKVLDVIDEPALAAIVTELIDGASLRAVLGRAGRLTGPQALDVMRGALRGLIAVHDAGLVHGDIKPDNILVDRRGVSRLIDFGLAREAGSALRADGSVAGSPAYMSPEQIKGGHVDGRSDLYACAAVLFELLTGRRPYVGDEAADVVRMHVHDPVPDPREIDPHLGVALARLCMTGLAKDPADRFTSAADFLVALQDAAGDRYGAAWRTGLGLGALAGAAAGVLTTQATRAAIPTDGANGAGAAPGVPARAAARRPSRSVRVGGSAVAAASVTVAIIVIVAVHAHSGDQAGGVPAAALSTTTTAAAGPGGSSAGSLQGTPTPAAGPGSTATPGPSPVAGTPSSSTPPTASTHGSPPCQADTFLGIARSTYGQTVTAAGPPTCAGGYAVETFTPYANGQEAPFFFQEASNGTWTLIEGGNATPTVACATIPAAVMAKFGFGCP